MAKKEELKGHLEIMKKLKIKPNFSELEREYGIGRHTKKNIMKGMKRKNLGKRKDQG